MSWCPSWSNSLWQGWSCGLVHCPGGNATDPIWRVLTSSDGISSWTPLKPQHSNPKPLANQLWCIGPLYSSHTFHHPSQTPCLRWISYATQKLMLNSCKMVEKIVWSILYVSVAIFPSLKHNFITYRSSKVSLHPDCIFEIHQLWQSGFIRVYFNCCCSCSFEPEIIKIGQSSHNMYKKKSRNLLDAPRICIKISWIYLYMYWVDFIYTIYVPVLCVTVWNPCNVTEYVYCHYLRLTFKKVFLMVCDLSALLLQSTENVNLGFFI